MLSRTVLAVALLSGIGAAPAAALEGRLVGLGGASIVFVWRDKNSHTEALSLIEAGVHTSNPALVYRLLSCMPASGTRVVTTSVGFATHDVLVIESPEAGCRGNIPAESLKTR